MRHTRLADPIVSVACAILLFDQNLCSGGPKLDFGLAAKAPKRDGCHGFNHRNLSNTNSAGRNEVAMSDFVPLGWLVLIVAILVALDSGLALIVIDRLAQSEGFTDVITITDVPTRF